MSIRLRRDGCKGRDFVTSPGVYQEFDEVRRKRYSAKLNAGL
jgi:hypothetical protein